MDFALLKTNRFSDDSARLQGSNHENLGGGWLNTRETETKWSTWNFSPLYCLSSQSIQHLHAVPAPNWAMVQYYFWKKVSCNIVSGTPVYATMSTWERMLTLKWRSACWINPAWAETMDLICYCEKIDVTMRRICAFPNKDFASPCIKLVFTLSAELYQTFFFLFWRTSSYVWYNDFWVHFYALSKYWLLVYSAWYCYELILLRHKEGKSQ